MARCPFSLGGPQRPRIPLHLSEAMRNPLHSLSNVWGSLACQRGQAWVHPQWGSGLLTLLALPSSAPTSSLSPTQTAAALPCMPMVGS